MSRERVVVLAYADAPPPVVVIHSSCPSTVKDTRAVGPEDELSKVDMQIDNKITVCPHKSKLI
ncbi:hypothetical protein Pcinc_031266, partial [Petrolisthes cinctipes]